MWSGLDRHSMHQKIYSNAQMTPRLIRQHCEIDDDSRRHLEHAMDQDGTQRTRLRPDSEGLPNSSRLGPIGTHPSPPYFRSHSIPQAGSTTGHDRNLGRERTLKRQSIFTIQGLNAVDATNPGYFYSFIQINMIIHSLIVILSNCDNIRKVVSQWCL
jgi:hypothetical protein